MVFATYRTVSLVATVAASPRMTGREQTAPAINYPLLQRFAVKPHDGNTTALVRCEINGVRLPWRVTRPSA
jgi:hypothetical protein